MGDVYRWPHTCSVVYDGHSSLYVSLINLCIIRINCFFLRQYTSDYLHPCNPEVRKLCYQT